MRIPGLDLIGWLALSGLLSGLIKYGLPYLHLSPSGPVLLLSVGSPAFLMGVWMLWQGMREKHVKMGSDKSESNQL
ncbi:MAG: hypothetical protein OHK0012_21280 [Synechococcales cyanobacterium]